MKSGPRALALLLLVALNAPVGAKRVEPRRAEGELSPEEEPSLDEKEVGTTGEGTLIPRRAGAYPRHWMQVGAVAGHAEYRRITNAQEHEAAVNEIKRRVGNDASSMLESDLGDKCPKDYENSKDVMPDTWLPMIASEAKCLGKGNFGTVYEAMLTCDSNNRTVNDRTVSAAVKIQNPKASASAQGAPPQHFESLMKSEMAIGKILKHPNIVRTFASAAGAKTDEYAMLLETADGGELFDNLGRDDATKVKWLIQMLEAMKYMHQSGIVNCDIKPQNVFIGNGNAKMADFGLACSLKSGYPSEATSCADHRGGSAIYMSPEMRLAGRSAHPSDDMWAMGVMIYEMFHPENKHPWWARITSEAELNNNLASLNNVAHLAKGDWVFVEPQGYKVYTDPAKQHFKPSLRALIRNLLQPDVIQLARTGQFQPSSLPKRITAATALDHAIKNVMKEYGVSSVPQSQTPNLPSCWENCMTANCHNTEHSDYVFCVNGDTSPSCSILTSDQQKAEQDEYRRQQAAAAARERARLQYRPVHRPFIHQQLRPLLQAHHVMPQMPVIQPIQWQWGGGPVRVS
jgi:serine/threonine protein kinase